MPASGLCGTGFSHVYSDRKLNFSEPAITTASLNSQSRCVHADKPDRYARVDLHCHSHYSDGALPVAELIERAGQARLSWFSITDHDTLASQAPAQQEAQRLGLNYVPGVEWSAQWQGHGIHVVGLGFDLQHPVSRTAAERQQQARWERAETIAANLERVGLAGARAWVQAQPAHANLGRPHFAAWLMAEHGLNNQNQAFKRYLGVGRVGDVKALWPEVDTVVRWVTAAGGVAVLAHPHRYRMTGRKRRQLVADFAAAGGAALEIGLPGLQLSMRDQLVRLAAEFDLFGSSGSDFHDDRQHWLALGAVPPLPEGIRPVWEVL